MTRTLFTTYDRVACGLFLGALIAIAKWPSFAARSASLTEEPHLMASAYLILCVAAGLIISRLLLNDAAVRASARHIRARLDQFRDHLRARELASRLRKRGRGLVILGRERVSL